MIDYKCSNSAAPDKVEGFKSDDELNLYELIQILWQGKWTIIIITIMFAAGSVYYALSQPNVYQASVLLAPAEESSAGLSQMAGQFGGIAALAGVNLGGSSNSQTELAVEVVKSTQFLESFVESHDLIVPIMAVKSWDSASDKLVIDDDLYNQSEERWLRAPVGLRGEIPSAQEIREKFLKDIFSINKNEENGLYTVSISYYSPELAKNWANSIVKALNDTMRVRAIEDANRNLTYLKEQLSKTSISEMQNTFYKLVEEQTKSLMLAEAQEEFVFKIVDPAIAPDIKIGPKRALICVLGTLLGGFLSILYVLLSYLFRKKPNELAS